jgi:penicillin amidase
VFARALARAVAAHGSDPARWRYGRWHRLHLRHPLDRRGLRRLVSRGPFPLGGDVDTLSLLTDAGRGTMIGASMRAVYDLGDPDGTSIALCGGQSGHPASRHYADLLPRWLRGDHVDLPMSRRRVEASAESRLVLSPE